MLINDVTSGAPQHMLFWGPTCHLQAPLRSARLPVNIQRFPKLNSGSLDVTCRSFHLDGEFLLFFFSFLGFNVFGCQAGQLPHLVSFFADSSPLCQVAAIYWPGLPLSAIGLLNRGELVTRTSCRLPHFRNFDL